MEKFQGTSAEHHSSTYPVSGVGVEGRIMDDKGSIRNVDGPSELKKELHVPRREFERKFEIVLLVENARMSPKRSANES
jgi:hypothetical protein